MLRFSLSRLSGMAWPITVGASSLAHVGMLSWVEQPYRPPVVVGQVTMSVDLSPTLPVQDPRGFQLGQQGSAVPAAIHRSVPPLPRDAGSLARQASSDDSTATASGDAVAAATPSPSHFVLAAPVVARTRSTSATSDAAEPSDAPRQGAAGSASSAGALFSEADVDVRAQLLGGARVQYPAEARLAEVEAIVPVELLVDAEGQVISAQALAEPGYGLAAAAVRSVTQYRFAPARKGGRAVAVRMRWLVEFRLH